MSHSAEPDEDEPRRSSAHARSDLDDAPAPPKPRPLSRWATLAPALIAVVALGVAIWALLRPPSDTPPPPSAQQVADAKGRACAAYNTVRTAVARQTQADLGTDPIASQAVAANARLAMAVGSQHLVDNLSPAVPPELAELLRSLATDLQDLTINALAGTAEDEASQVARLQGLEANSAKIVELCK
jgi:cytoskeletal protein RodZ